jgi:hypothetical protein
METASPSRLDGFNGARDAYILARADLDFASMTAHVQATYYTRGLLKRAGIKQPKNHEFYQVAFEMDRFNRWQLASLPIEDAAKTA